MARRKRDGVAVALSATATAHARVRAALRALLDDASNAAPLSVRAVAKLAQARALLGEAQAELGGSPVWKSPE